MNVNSTILLFDNQSVSRLYRVTPPGNQVVLNCHCQGEGRHALQPDCPRDLRFDCRNCVGDYFHSHVQQTEKTPRKQLHSKLGKVSRSGKGC